MGQIAEIAKEMQEKWERELMRNQRTIFSSVFEEMEFKNNNEGMNKEEYELFLAALPESYREYLESTTTFEQLAGLDDLIDIDEFSKFLDELEHNSVNLSVVSSNPSNNNLVPNDDPQVVISSDIR